MALPSLNEIDENVKIGPLRAPEPPRAAIVAWLEQVSAGRARSSLKVLDVGCGRGGAVAYLLEQGFDAYGIDVRSDYVANGTEYLGAGRLAVASDGEYPYPEDHFDIVISDQVFEHVANLDQLAGEVARTTKTGGMGLHVFPGKWTFTERHLQAPLVHWLPKGPVRRAAIKTALRCGCAAPYFSERPLAERAQIFSEYSEGETFYRRPAVIRKVLTSAGLAVDFGDVARQRVLSVLGDPPLPAAAVTAAAWLYRNTRMMYAATVKAG
jgi:SAM-dependent methyltransferase